MRSSTLNRYIILGWCCVQFFVSKIEGQHEENQINEQKWGYVTIRPNAHMFWWLYYTMADVLNYTDRPLIIWLQGGPGMASSGYGNFLEIGPLDTSWERRNYTPVEDYNILFIDNPIGVGFSYVSTEDNTLLPTNNEEIGDDLIKFLKIFMKEHNEFENVPLYIFGESYGGKMVVEFAYQIVREKKKGKLKCNIKGIGLGDSYISSIDYIKNYAPMAYHLGLVDKLGFTRIDELAKQIQVLINNKEFEEAAGIEHTITNMLTIEMPALDIYNFGIAINNTIPSFMEKVPELISIMNNEVKKKLSINSETEWELINEDVYNALQGDLLKPVTTKVESLLNNTDMKIIVYNGIMDIICNTAGTRAWVDNLNWKSKSKWQNETQEVFYVNSVTEGYMKKADNLRMYTIFRAGHSIPMDNMPAFRQMLLDEIVDDQ